MAIAAPVDIHGANCRHLPTVRGQAWPSRRSVTPARVGPHSRRWGRGLLRIGSCCVPYGAVDGFEDRETGGGGRGAPCPFFTGLV